MRKDGALLNGLVIYSSPCQNHWLSDPYTQNDAVHLEFQQLGSGDGKTGSS